MNASSPKFRDHLSLILLSLLKSRAMYGYELAQAVKTKSQGLIDLREGVLYPALHKMVEDGMLESEWGEGENGPRRRYYKVTSKGRKVQAKQREAWLGFSEALQRVLGEFACNA